MSTKTKKADAPANGVKHTPGPWFIDREAPPLGNGLNGIAIAHKDECNRNKGLALVGLSEGEDNARLIAAAPDLYEACKEAEVMLRGARAVAPMTDVLNAVIDQVQAALTKADGGRP